MIQEQRLLDADTGKAADHGAGKQLTRRQEEVRKETEDLRPAAATPDTAKALDGADTAMGEAAQKLAEAGAAEAQPPQEAALAALYKAQDALADRMRQMAKELGQPPPAAQTVAGAQAEVGKAQEEAGAAQQALAQGADAGMRRAAAQLDQAARKMAQAGAHPQALAQDARDAIRGAEQALAGAAAAAAAGERQQAQGQAGEGRQELAAAQSALARMQAGIAEAPQPASEKNWKDQPGAVKAGTAGAHGAGQFLGLPERDRAAIEQSQAEKYPQEYGAMIEEYMRRLANDAGGK